MTKGFSLIELLVVVAIIAVLASIAIPIYNQYAIRTQVGTAMSQFQAIVESALVTYSETGSFPSPITINGYSIPATVPSTVPYQVNMPNISWVGYGVSTDGKSVYFQITLTGNQISKIPGYSNSKTGPNAIVTFAWRDVNGAMVSACGAYSNTYISEIVPSTYLPSECSCLSVGAFFTSGASATCGSSWT